MIVTRISVRPDICHGRPCIRGTRIQVVQVLDLLSAGKSFQEIIDDYFPGIVSDDIGASIEFANDCDGHSKRHPVSW